ncbi:hypothetical protein NKK52_18110 [Mesorhizobium sp. C277A]|uniref:hypothetical protein n=1 Tax=Mesorhizobium sp. C277A TaxID=2956827 RepID=UPI001AEC64D7|nr:hypothetical protein [Mesorhizobium sp. LSJC277A00]
MAVKVARPAAGLSEAKVEARDLGSSCPNQTGRNNSSGNNEQKVNPCSFDARKASTPCKKSMAVPVGLQ